MVSNEQLILAFRELLTHVENYSVRADAILEYMLQRGEMNRQELNQVMEAAKEMERAKWDKIRARMDSLLQEEEERVPV